MGRERGGAETQSVTTNIPTKEVFDKAAFKKRNIYAIQKE
jgi:hypothetical protein